MSHRPVPALPSRRRLPVHPRDGVAANLNLNPVPGIGQWLADWVAGAFGLVDPGGEALHALADRLREAGDPAEVRRVLLEAASRVPGVASAKVVDDPSEGGPSPRTLRLAMVAGGRWVGTLLLRRQRGDWPSRPVRLLRTMATLAACAEAATRRPGADEASPPVPAHGLPDASALAIFLDRSLAQSRRRGGGLVLLVVAPDELGTIRRRHGERIAEAVARQVARAVAGTLRRGDLVAQLDADHLVAVLPEAQADDAAAVAEAVRRAIAEAGLVGPVPAPLTACLGVAASPDHGETPGPLLAAARDALRHAQAGGPDRIGVGVPSRGHQVAKTPALRL